MEIKILFSVLAAISGLAASVPYIWTSYFGKTRPHVFTWLIWTITNSVAVAGLWYGGGGVGAVPPTLSAICAFVTFLVSLRFGKKDIKPSDIIVLIIALSSILIWLFLHQPILSILIVAGADLIGYIPTYRKAYHEPWTEKRSSWIFFSTASIFAILALKEYNLLTLSYLITIACVNTIMPIYLTVRRSMKGSSEKEISRT